MASSSPPPKRAKLFASVPLAAAANAVIANEPALLELIVSYLPGTNANNDKQKRGASNVLQAIVSLCRAVPGLGSRLSPTNEHFWRALVLSQFDFTIDADKAFNVEVHCGSFYERSLENMHAEELDESEYVYSENDEEDENHEDEDEGTGEEDNVFPETNSRSVFERLKRTVYDSFSDWRTVYVNYEYNVGPQFFAGPTKWSERWIGFVGERQYEYWGSLAIHPDVQNTATPVQPRWAPFNSDDEEGNNSKKTKTDNMRPIASGVASAMKTACFADGVVASKVSSAQCMGPFSKWSQLLRVCMSTVLR